MNSYPQFPSQITIFTASNFYYIYVQIGFLKSRVLCNCGCELPSSEKSQQSCCGYIEEDLHP